VAKLVIEINMIWFLSETIANVVLSKNISILIYFIRIIYFHYAFRRFRHVINPDGRGVRSGALKYNFEDEE